MNEPDGPADKEIEEILSDLDGILNDLTEPGVVAQLPEQDLSSSVVENPPGMPKRIPAQAPQIPVRKPFEYRPPLEIGAVKPISAAAKPAPQPAPAAPAPVPKPAPQPAPAAPAPVPKPAPQPAPAVQAPVPKPAPQPAPAAPAPVPKPAPQPAPAAPAPVPKPAPQPAPVVQAPAPKPAPQPAPVVQAPAAKPAPQPAPVVQAPAAKPAPQPAPVVQAPAAKPAPQPAPAVQAPAAKPAPQPAPVVQAPAAKPAPQPAPVVQAPAAKPAPQPAPAVQVVPKSIPVQQESEDPKIPKEQVRRLAFVFCSGQQAKCAELEKFLRSTALKLSKKPLHLRCVILLEIPEGCPVQAVLEAVQSAHAAGVVAVLSGLPEAKVHEFEEAFSQADCYFKAVSIDQVQKKTFAMDMMLEIMLLRPGS